MGKATVPALVAALAVLAPVSAGAQDIVSMQMPSHNIYCQAVPPGLDGPQPSLRCDIEQKSTRVRRDRPAVRSATATPSASTPRGWAIWSATATP